MKEPDEVKNMQQMIHQLYEKKKQTTQATQTTPQVKHNYKNIDVLPTVYDEVDSSGMDPPQDIGENIQEGFLIDKLQRKKWKAPYTGPPKEGPIKDIKHHPADQFHNILLKGESLMKYMLDNEEYIDDILGTHKKEKKKNTKFQLKSLFTPFGDCPCIVFPKKLSLKEWSNFQYSILAFFTDYIPCLINGYSKAIVTNFTPENEYVSERDKDNVKGLVVEFLYILVSGYLSMILFYYTTIDPNWFMDISETIQEYFPLGEDMERLFGYLGFPVMIFNKIFRDFIPNISSFLGLAPYAKLNYIYLFMVSIAIIFNGGMSLWVDMAKDALKFKGHAIIYGLVLIAIAMKIFDISSYTDEYISRMNSLSIWLLEIIRVAIIIFIALLLTPMSQMFLVAHVFWLFLILPLYKFLEPLNEVSKYIFDPAKDSSCDVPTELFFGVLAQLITKYIFPVMFPLVLLIFFGYRLYLSRSLHSSSLRLLMLIIHLCIIVAIAFYLFILWVRSSKSLDNTVNLEPNSEGKPLYGMPGDI